MSKILTIAAALGFAEGSLPADRTSGGWIARWVGGKRLCREQLGDAHARQQSGLARAMAEGAP